MAKETYESTRGRAGFLDAMNLVLNRLHKNPYFGFIPEENRTQAVGRLVYAIQFMEMDPTVEFLPTRMLFPEMESEQMVKLGMFLKQQGLQFCHNILFAPFYEVAAKLSSATGMLYPEVLMDLRSAYVELNDVPARGYIPTEAAPLGPR